MDWGTVLASLGSSALLAAFVTAILAHVLSARLEAIKTDNAVQIEGLKASHLERVERLRTELNTDAHQREVQFSRLHEKRVEILGELYKKLVEAELILGWLEASATGVIAPDERLPEAASKAIMSFLEFSLTHRVWFDAPLCDLLNQFHANQLVSQIQAARLSGAPTLSPPPSQDALAQLHREGDALRLLIEQQMRTVLGV